MYGFSKPLVNAEAEADSSTTLSASALAGSLMRTEIIPEKCQRLSSSPRRSNFNVESANHITARISVSLVSESLRPKIIGLKFT